MSNLRRWVSGLAVLAAFAGVAGAQVGTTTGALLGSALTCSANVAVPPQLRAEGVTELLGDIVLVCSGGAAATAGSLIPTANITVSLGTNVTSKLMPGGGSEALLLIDEPGSGLPGPGPALGQTVCGSTAGGGFGGCFGNAAGAAGLYANVFGSKSAASQCAAFTGSTCSSFGNTPNVFVGTVSANQVTFTGIPILPPAYAGYVRVFRITNVRANAAGLGFLNPGGTTPLNLSIAISGSTSLPITNPVQLAGFIQSSVTTSVRNTANSGALTAGTGSLAFLQCAAVPGSGSAPVAGATLRFAENFATAFKTRVAPTATTNGLFSGPIFSQNIPGNIYNSESGFILPVPGGTAGLSDSGTRLRAVFTGIPAGVKAWVTTTNYQGTGGNTIGTGTDTTAGGVLNPLAPAGFGTPIPSIAQLVQDETTADSNNQAPTVNATMTVGNGSIALAPVTLSNGSGEAVWEVVAANPNVAESFDFGVYFSFAAGAVGSGTGTVNLSLAPAPGTPGTAPSSVYVSASASLPISRFVDTSTAANIVTVTSCTPNVSVTSSLVASTWGQSVTLTATVAASSGSLTPTGSVTFKDGSATLGVATLNGSGQAPFSTSALSAGSHTITAVYGGDANFTATTSSALTEMVNQASQAIAFGALSAQTYGTAPFTVSASSSSSLAVSFASTTSPVCTISGSTVTILAAGTCSITASQAGNADYAAAPNVPQSFTVNKAVLTVTADYATKVAGAPMPTLTVTITGLVNGDPRSVVTGAPSLSTTATATSPAGMYPISVSAGTLAAANYSFAFVNGTLLVNNAINTSVGGNTPAPPGSFVGQSFTTPGGGPWTSITFTFFSDQGQTPGAAGTAYLFSQPYSGTPGDLTGLLGGPHSSAVSARRADQAHVAPAGFLGASAGISGGAYVFGPSVTLQSNTAYYLYVDAPAGSFPAGVMTGGAGNTSFTASSSGSGFVTSTGSTNFRLSAVSVAPPPPPPTSTVTLSSSANPTVLGQTVTFTATVSGSAATPTGTVQFLDGSAVMGTSQVGAGGQAIYSTKTLAIGSHLITASYGGGGGYPGAQDSLAQTVNALASSVTLTASASSAVFGQAVVLTAAVGPTAPPAGFAAPGGQVSFYLGGSGPVGARTLLGSAAVSGGTATFSVRNLAIGTWYLFAQYGGDGTWASSVGQVAVTMSAAPTSTSVALNLVSGKPVLSAAVTPAPPGAGTPTGNVQFIDTSNQTVVANASILNGAATAALAASAAQSVLARPIAAIYAGDVNFRGSSSAALPRLTNGANGSAAFAPDQLATLFGAPGLTGDTTGVTPLGTSLAGVSLKITDSTGADRMALLYGVFASAAQINFVVPAGTAPGMAGVTVTLPGGATMSTAVQVGPVAPGIFTANMNGSGVYAGQVIHVQADGSQTLDNPAVWDAASHAYVESPIDLGGAGERVYLVLYGTGLYHASSVTATVGGVTLPVVYFGQQGQFPGIDQVNVQVPATLAGAGLVKLTIAADGQPANTVTLSIR
jgi:uncharacterized protein (TIGR03437 family)